MELFLMLFSLAGITYTIAAAVGCELGDNGVKYKAELILKDEIPNIMRPKELAVDKKTNTLYFNFYDETDGDFKSAKLNLNTKNYNIIEELQDLCSFTVDQSLGIVYAGCYGGLYRYNTDLNKFVSIADKSLYKHVYFNQDLYVIKGQDGVLYKFVGNEEKKVGDNVSEIQEIIVDNIGDKVYKKYTGVLYQKAEASDLIEIPETSDLVALAVGSDGSTYACDYAGDKIVSLKKESGSFNKVVSANWCHGLAVDKEDNFVYADWENNTIVRVSKC